MTLAELTVTARDLGLDADTITGLARPAVVLRPHTHPVGDRAGSWLGGLPTLPRDTAWPAPGGHALAFIAQVACDDLPVSLVEQGFPAHGALCFFYDAIAMPWKSGWTEAPGAAVVYVSDPADTKIPEWPDDLPDDVRYDIRYLSAHETIALPPIDSPGGRTLRLTEDQHDAYQKLVAATAGEGAWSSRFLLGRYPDQIQEDMTAECALIDLKAGGREPIGRDRKARPNLREQASHWRLLLQVPTIEPVGMMWGDAGCLYYWIHEEDLRARRFDRICVFLQSD
jgi:uncharacterized protein YwqG